MNRRLIVPLLPLLLLAASRVHALPIRVLPWDEDVAERKLAIAHAKSATEIGYMHPFARSEPIDVPAKAENLRLEALDRVDAEGKLAAVPLRIPAGVRRPLLLLLPDEKAPTGLRTMILEDDERSFRWGTIRLVNATGKPLVFRWEKKAAALAAGWKPVEVAPGGRSRNMEVMLYLREAPERPLYSAIWEHRDTLRQLVFVVPNADPSLGPVDFKFIAEDRRAVEGAEAGAGG